MLHRILYILSLHSPAHLFKAGINPASRCPVMVLIVLLVGFAAQVRAAVITGRIEDAHSGRPLKGANVRIAELAKATSASVSGDYLISGIPGGSWILSASHIGFLAESQRFRIGRDDTLHLDFRLRETAVPLEEVVYTATRTLKTLKTVPVATELITRQDFQRRGAITVADALETEIGYEVSEDFSGQGVMLQGVDPDKVLILVDGNRVIGRVNGSIDLDQISVSNVKQIEVVKGSVSTLYGSEAIGGVINVITGRPAENLRLCAEFLGGSYISDEGEHDGLNWSPGISLSNSSGKWGYSAGGRVSRTGLIDITPNTAHTDGVPGSLRYNGDFKVTYGWKPDLTLTGASRLMVEKKNWAESAGLQSIDLAYDDHETNRSGDLSVEALYTPSPKIRESLRLYHSRNHHDWEKRTQPQYGPVNTIDFSRGNEDFTELSTQMTRPIGADHLLTFGGDLYYWNINSESATRTSGGDILSPFSGSLTAGSLFLQDEWQIEPSVSLLPGVRFEMHEIYGANFAPRISQMFVLLNDVKIRLSAGIGYRAPSSKELYYTFNHSAAGYIVYGNPDLKPERSRTYSVSFEHNYQDNSVARVSFFHNNLRDLIDFDSTGANEEFFLGTYQYLNISSAWVRGIEVERGLKPLAGLELKGSYTYMESHNGLTGNVLLRRPKHSARWDVTYKHSNWTGKVWGRFTSKSMFTDRFATNEQESDEWTVPYEVWNGSLSREWGSDWVVFAKLENALDKTHGRYGPYEGRTVSLGLNWSLNR